MLAARVLTGAEDLWNVLAGLGHCGRDLECLGLLGLFGVKLDLCGAQGQEEPFSERRKTEFSDSLELPYVLALLLPGLSLWGPIHQLPGVGLGLAWG